MHIAESVYLPKGIRNDVVSKYLVERSVLPNGRKRYAIDPDALADLGEFYPSAAGSEVAVVDDNEYVYMPDSATLGSINDAAEGNASPFLYALPYIYPDEYVMASFLDKSYVDSGKEFDGNFRIYHGPDNKKISSDDVMQIISGDLDPKEAYEKAVE
jgi:hypothetical protein